MEKKNELIVVNGELNLEISKRLKEFELLKKDIEAKRDAYVEAIKTAMEANGITKFENEFVTINYIGETVANTFDTSKFKVDQPEVYSQYTKQTPKKAFIKITTKG